MLKINIIVSYSDNLVIGNDNNIPWDYSEDLQYFNKITMDRNDKNKYNVVIFGYETYLHLPIKIFKNRIIIVITNKVSDYDNNENNNYDNTTMNLSKLSVDKELFSGTNVKENINNHVNNLEDIENKLYFVDSLGSSMELCHKLYDMSLIENIFIGGGESIYSYYLTSYYYKWLDKIYITRINSKYEGNKKFYDLNDKYYYLSITKSKLYKEIEYRVLQCDNDFINPETSYLNYFQRIVKFEMTKVYNLKLNFDLTKYFPIFSIIKPNIIPILNSLLVSIHQYKFEINYIINKINNQLSNNEINNQLSNNEIKGNDLLLDLFDIKPFYSKYKFNIDKEKFYLDCIVEHKTGTILSEVVVNILFSSLLTYLISKQTNLNSNILEYLCIEATFTKEQIYTIDKLAFTTPNVISILNINKKDNIEDYTMEDLEILGMT